MKKLTNLVFIAFLITIGGISAQSLPEGMVRLLPEGVKANIENTRKVIQRKNLMVVGEKTKGYKAFFSADDVTHGEELWVTDGTVLGTRMVKDINPGVATSDVNWLSRFNDKVVFAADDGVNGMELWISDGTEEGTKMVKDIHELGSSSPIGFIQVNETQFVFYAKNFDSENYSDRGPQSWLWVSDGTEAGTKMIYECDAKYPGQVSTSFDAHNCRVGRRVFFKANNKEGTTGEELWVTDGTTNGTKLVKDINIEQIATGTANSAIDNMANFYNEKLFFKGFSIEHGNEPWCSDGTESGTYMIYDSDPTFTDAGFPRGGDASCTGTFPYNGKIYFRGKTPDVGSEIAYTNLDSGNYTITDINKNTPTGSNSSSPGPGAIFDGVYFFSANTGADATKENNFGGELHYIDGETVVMQSDLAPGAQHCWPKDFTVVSGSMFYWTDGTLSELKQKLYRINKKTDTPQLVADLNPDGDKIHTLRNLGGDLIFATADAAKTLYSYHYRKEGFDKEKDTENLDVEFRTRAEIQASSIKSISANKISVYPNPTADKFSFNVQGKIESVKVYDITGSLIINEKNLTENSINISNFPKGIYSVLITSSDRVYFSNLIIR